jgi:hypothetical protein
MLLDYCEGLYPSKGTRKQDGTGHPNHGLLLSDFLYVGSTCQVIVSHQA